MVWVKSEYAEELAVLVTWLSALLPWSVSYGTFAVSESNELTLVILRFPYLAIRYQLGFQILNGTTVQTPLGFRQEVVAAGESTAAQIPGFDLWLVALALLTVALAISFLMYFEVDAVDALPLDPVRILGGLLLAVGVVLLGSTYVLFSTQSALFIPFGVLLHLAFGVILLRVDLVDPETTGDATDESDARDDAAK
jgi:uncharacterized protein (TIGR04206 family)